MKIGRTPSEGEIRGILAKEEMLREKIATAKKELSELEPDGWLVYEYESESSSLPEALIGYLALRDLLPKKGEFDLLTSGNKTFVHRIK